MTTTTTVTDDTVTDTTAGTPTPHYRRPGWVTRHVMNRLVARMTRMGVSVWGSRVLEVEGRRSGEPRRVPVNLLELDGARYLVSARGEGEWRSESVRPIRPSDHPTIRPSGSIRPPAVLPGIVPLHTTSRSVMPGLDPGIHRRRATCRAGVGLPGQARQ